MDTQAFCIGAWVGFISVSATWGYCYVCLEKISTPKKIIIGGVLTVLVLCVGLNGFIL